MELLQPFKDFIASHVTVKDPSFLVALSGGLDSVVLVELCRQAGYTFAIAHCNFGLRGTESDNDELFVTKLGQQYGVDVFVRRFDTETYARENKISIQEAARSLRYEWFSQVRKDNGFFCTLLAHHADDNMETLLMNFFRGTGLKGLTGIPNEYPEQIILRPLLPVRRSQIVEFARQSRLEWREDSSNSSSKYTRNYFRNELLPGIRKVFPGVDENLLDNIERFKKTHALYQIGVQELKKTVCESAGAELRIPVLKLMKYQHTSLLFEVIREYGFGENYVHEVTKLASSASGRFIENDHYQIIKHRAWLIIAPKTAVSNTCAIDQKTGEVVFADGKISMKTIPINKFQLDKRETVAQLDARMISFPLLLRQWKQGDYFYPLGMRKKKKVARFLIDRKLSKNQKEQVWVLESDKKIVWVLGLRIDDRFKVIPSTKEVLIINWTTPASANNIVRH